MPISILSTDSEFERYDNWVRLHPEGTLWQSLEWKDYQEARGREVRIYLEERGESIHSTALVVIDKTTGGFSTWNLPRGPISASVEFMKHLVQEAKRAKCLCMYTSSEEIIGKVSNRLEMPEATRVIDLSLSEGKILDQMKPKGRYNIRVAEKNGISVTQSRDIDVYYEIAKKTALRDGFTPPSKAAYEKFLEIPGSFLLLAFTKDTLPIAGLLGVTWGNETIYYYGASDHDYRNLMAPYALQWHAIKYAKSVGSAYYDFFGVSPKDSENHPWSGVTSFKEKFGGEYREEQKERQVILKPVMYWLLQVKRKLFS